MVERGIEVDHTTLYGWVQRYAPEMEKRLRWYWKRTMGYSASMRVRRSKQHERWKAFRSRFTGAGYKPP